MHAFPVTLSGLGAIVALWGYARVRAAYLYRSELTDEETRVWDGAGPAPVRGRAEEAPREALTAPGRNGRATHGALQAARER
jgi:hypothetical protein